MKRRRLMKLLLIPLVILIAVYASVCFLLYLRQERLIFYPEVLPANAQFDFPGRVQERTWQVAGATIHGLHFRVERPKGVVLYWHGNAGSVSGWGDVASSFTDRGYDVVLPDYRGYGKSTGQMHDEGQMLADAEVVYADVLREYPADQVVMYGRSLGSGVATALATTTTPRLLILETPYLSFAALAHEQFPFVPTFLLKYPLHTDRRIAKVGCPVVIFHGTADEVIPYHHSEQLVALIQTEHRLVRIDGGGHNNLAAFPDYTRELDQALATGR